MLGATVAIGAGVVALIKGGSIMPLWLVIYVAGSVAGSVGPVTVPFGHCVKQAAQFWADIPAETVTPNGMTRADVRFVCEYHAERPKLQAINPFIERRS